MEEDAITLYSRFRKIVFTKNKVRLSNDLITGECDIHTFLMKKQIDIKCSWSLDTLPMFGLQIQWIAITNIRDLATWIYLSKNTPVAYCLVNAPANLILNEKKNCFMN